MSFKKVVPLLTLVFALVLPFSSAFAAWHDVWEGSVHWDSWRGAYVTQVDGAPIYGQVNICNESSGKVYFYIREYDPGAKNSDGTSADAWITYTSLAAGACGHWDVSAYQDPGNNLAEIYVQTSSSGVRFKIQT